MKPHPLESSPDAAEEWAIDAAMSEAAADWEGDDILEQEVQEDIKKELGYPEKGVLDNRYSRPIKIF